jgi:hypothetical protein
MAGGSIDSIYQIEQIARLLRAFLVPTELYQGLSPPPVELDLRQGRDLKPVQLERLSHTASVAVSTVLTRQLSVGFPSMIIMMFIVPTISSTFMVSPAVSA